MTEKITVDKNNFSFKNLFFALKNSFIIIASMLWSYIYIPYYIILYIINKKKSSNFINLIKTDDFISIKSNINPK